MKTNLGPDWHQDKFASIVALAYLICCDYTTHSPADGSAIAKSFTRNILVLNFTACPLLLLPLFLVPILPQTNQMKLKTLVSHLAHGMKKRPKELKFIILIQYRFMLHRTEYWWLPLSKLQINAIKFERVATQFVKQTITQSTTFRIFAVSLVKTLHHSINKSAYHNTAWCLVTEMCVPIVT